jgi:hypothetical protein
VSTRAAARSFTSSFTSSWARLGVGAALAAVLAPAARAEEAAEPVPLYEAGAPDSTEDRLGALERRLADTQAVLNERRPLVTTSGYVDFGFFAAQGDGSGVVQDLGPASARYFPQYADPSNGWVFLGDLLAPAVNSRGEPADLGNLTGATNRFDSVDSNGAPSFILNEVNLTLDATIASSALATVSVDFLPRSGSDFRLGDVFEVDLAQVEWMVGARRRTSVFAGKMESVIGIEYRERKARNRFGITPSLLARYTTGTPLGVKVRTKLGENDWLILAAAVTNGSSTIETFHFYDEIDSNAGKTASGRVSIAPGAVFELGVSGQYGAQDRALDSLGALWFAGVDLQLHLGTLEIKGQWLTGRGAGETGRIYAEPHRPFGLTLHNGAYLEGDLMITPWLGVLARGELRDALVWLGDRNAPVGTDPTGAERLYLTKGWRAVAGLRFVPSEHVVLKAEVLHNGEYGGVPLVRDDVITSSLVLIY